MTCCSTLPAAKCSGWTPDCCTDPKDCFAHKAEFPPPEERSLQNPKCVLQVVDNDAKGEGGEGTVYSLTVHFTAKQAEDNPLGTSIRIQEQAMSALSYVRSTHKR